MKTKIHQKLLLVLCLSSLLFSSKAVAGTRIDPHGKAGMCTYCHTSNVTETAEGGYRKNSIEAACLECHGKKGANLKEYLHGMLPDVRNKKKLVDYFGISEGILIFHVIAATTPCHQRNRQAKNFYTGIPIFNLTKTGKSWRRLVFFVTRSCRIIRIPAFTISRCDTMFHTCVPFVT
jgi:hypothetical protein